MAWCYEAPSPSLLGATEPDEGAVCGGLPSVEALPRGPGVLRWVEGWFSRDPDPALRMCLPPADSCPEVGGYMRRLVEKRPDPSPPGLLATPSAFSAAHPYGFVLRGA